jgi:uncharacterized membrane protein YedE/YeeE
VNPAPQAFSIGGLFKSISNALFVNPWPWWVAGIALGLALAAILWFTGRKPGISTGYADACKKADPETASRYLPARPERLWFLLGIPLGALLANVGWWDWTWTFGRMDMVSSGNFLVKIFLLLTGGILLGFGARWAGGCVAGHTLTGIPMGHRMSLVMTAAFLAAAAMLAYILFKVL